MAKAGAHGGAAERARQLDLAAGRDRREASPPVGGGETARPATSGRRTKSGIIEIDLGSGNRVRVDNDVDADALRRVLSVLGER